MTGLSEAQQLIAVGALMAIIAGYWIWSGIVRNKTHAQFYPIKRAEFPRIFHAAQIVNVAIVILGLVFLAKGIGLVVL